ncbi:MAG TPA: ABC transporter permease [Jatrophihabitans sp.]|jgi:lipooligosaccharide transport system permease protein|nr:ABC transporter permease [Jatrophihabitans sp.]
MTATATAEPVTIWQIVEHEVLDARRYWRSVVVAGLVTPLLYVLALGIGLGTVVNNHGNSLGVPYVQFVAPAFLAAAALQTATASATFPVMAGFKWIRYYHGMAATPLTPRQICDGKLLWIGLRTVANSTIYLAIMSCFGALHRWQGVVGILAATLTGMAFAAPVLALSASVTAEGQAFNILFRFVVTPMFLFSGTFYPISQLPRWGEIIAYVSPLWHGTVLARGAALGHLSDLAALGHICYLLAWLVVGIGLARWRFRVRLTE